MKSLMLLSFGKREVAEAVIPKAPAVEPGRVRLILRAMDKISGYDDLGFNTSRFLEHAQKPSINLLIVIKLLVGS